MSYLGPVRVDPIGHLKAIFPEDVSENMTWMCLANPRFFCFAEKLSSRLPALLCRVDRENLLLSNVFALPLSTIADEPKYIGVKSQKCYSFLFASCIQKVTYGIRL